MTAALRWMSNSESLCRMRLLLLQSREHDELSPNAGATAQDAVRHALARYVVSTAVRLRGLEHTRRVRAHGGGRGLAGEQASARLGGVHRCPGSPLPSPLGGKGPRNRGTPCAIACGEPIGGRYGGARGCATGRRAAAQWEAAGDEGPARP